MSLLAGNQYTYAENTEAARAAGLEMTVSTSAPGECSLSTILRCARDLTGLMLMQISGRCAHDPSAAPGPTDTGPKLAIGCSPVSPVGASQFTCPTVTWGGTQGQLANVISAQRLHACELNCVATCSVVLIDSM